MTVGELANALARMVEAGHKDLPVHHVTGDGVEKPICGWELVAGGHFYCVRTRELKRTAPRLKMFTTLSF